MKRALLSFLLLGVFFYRHDARAHPGSGIVVDRQGNVYFVDTGTGVWKIDHTGKLTRLSGPAYHWMAVDLEGRLDHVTLPYFSSGDATVARVGSNPTLLLSSDFPLVVGRDGSLYYTWATPAEEVKIFRLTPSGQTTVFKTLPPTRTETGQLRWRNGIAATKDGAIYYSEDRAVRRISPQGEVTTVVSNLTLPDCDVVLGVESELGTYCRGLDVDSAGTVYVAATGCRAVVKITSDKKVTTVLRAQSPWSPTGVALFGSDLYVLEYVHTESDDRREWLPRIRRVSSDGRVVTIATIDRR